MDLKQKENLSEKEVVIKNTLDSRSIKDDESTDYFNIDEFMWKFPVVTQEIFSKLDNISLTKCLEVDKPWCNFIESQKFYWTRRIIKYSLKMKKFDKEWKKITQKAPVQTTKELALAVENFFGPQKFIHPYWRQVYWQFAPQHIVAQFGSLDLFIKITCVLGENSINPKTLGSETPFHYAAMKGHLEICRVILKKNIIEKNPGNFRGSTPLHFAAKYGHVETWALIAENVENKNVVDNYQNTPLHLAAENGHLEMCRVILQNIIEKNPGDSRGLTPLHFAAKYGHVETWALIAENVENKNVVDNYQNTPLHLAAENGHLEVCKLIIKNVDNRSPIDNLGRTPLGNAVRKDHFKTSAFLLKSRIPFFIPVPELLLEWGIRVL